MMQLRESRGSAIATSEVVPEEAREGAARTGSRNGRKAKKSVLRAAWANERAQALAARGRGDAAEEWHYLERAHILSQPLALLHVRTHLDMIGAAVRRRDRHEIAGQVFRLIVAGPGSVSGRYPLGNTGGADVSAFVPMPIPEDLRAILDGDIG